MGGQLPRPRAQLPLFACKFKRKPPVLTSVCSRMEANFYQKLITIALGLICCVAQALDSCVVRDRRSEKGYAP